MKTPMLVIALLASSLAYAQPEASTHPAQERNPCLERIPLTWGERLTLSKFKNRLRALDDALGTPLYRTRLAKVIEQNSPDLNTPRLKELAFEALVEQDFRELIGKTIGVDANEFQKFNTLKTRAILQNDLGFDVGRNGEAILSSANDLRAKLVSHFNSQLNQPGISETQKAVLNRKKLQALMSLDLIQDLSLQEYLTHLSEQNGKKAVVQKLSQAGVGLAAFVAIYTYAGELVAGSTSVGEAVAPALARFGGPAGRALASYTDEFGTIVGGCLSGGLGGGSLEMAFEAYDDFAEASSHARLDGTTVSCELRRIVEAKQDTAFSSLAEKVAVSTASGCVVVGAAIPFPEKAGKFVFKAVQGFAVKGAGEVGWHAGKAVDSYMDYLDEVAKLEGRAHPCESASVKEMFASVESEKSLEQSAKALKAYYRIKAQNSISQAERLARNGQDGMAREYLKEAMKEATEAGDALMETAVTTILANALKHELPEVLHQLAAKKGVKTKDLVHDSKGHPTHVAIADAEEAIAAGEAAGVEAPEMAEVMGAAADEMSAAIPTSGNPDGAASHTASSKVGAVTNSSGTAANKGGVVSTKAGATSAKAGTAGAKGVSSQTGQYVTPVVDEVHDVVHPEQPESEPKKK